MNLKPNDPDNIANYQDHINNKLINLYKMTHLHSETVYIAKGCVEQLQKLMPGCEAKVIITTPYMEAHHGPEKQANGNGGVFFMTKHNLSELSYVTINTEQ